MRLAEFIAIYLIAPILMAVFLPKGWLFPALSVFSIAGLSLLAMTQEFQWRSLFRGISQISLRSIVLVAVLSGITGILIIQRWHPDALFIVPRERPQLMLMIALFYPILSVLPQELIYRPLYFRRYGHLLPSGRCGLVLNAAFFSLGHLMYWSWIVTAMTFIGGLIFAWAYETRQNFPLTLILHSVAGVILFAVGMGIYFYSGNVVRPF